MARSNAELVGRSVSELATPCLIVDEAALTANLELLASYFEDRVCKIRPHFKAHKCVSLARRQLSTGSCVGICCAKLSEAEVLVEGGIEDVLIANQVVGPDKATRLARLNRTATVRCAVDDCANIAELGAAAAEEGVTVGILVEVDVGMKRCGVPPGQPAVTMAQLVAATPGLRFDGLQGYEGHAVVLPDYDERKQRVTEDLGMLVDTRRAIESSGLPVKIVSSGGTGTYDITGNIPGIDEVQCGTYALMDVFYAQVRPEFAIARSILATVVSNKHDQVVVDVGLKGIGGEFCDPVLLEYPEAKPRYVSEEHTPFMEVTEDVGKRVYILPPHGCTTNNLHRELYLVRNGKVVDVWPIEGAGCLE